MKCVQDRSVRERCGTQITGCVGNEEEDNCERAEVGTARRKRRFEKQFAAGKDEEIASRSVLPRAWMACESVQVAAAHDADYDDDNDGDDDDDDDDNNVVAADDDNDPP